VHAGKKPTTKDCFSTIFSLEEGAGSGLAAGFASLAVAFAARSASCLALLSALVSSGFFGATTGSPATAVYICMISKMRCLI
jgi:hypothetical protein